MFCHQLTPNGELVALQVIENMVARDGVEPPTPAFSGLATTIVSASFLNSSTPEPSKVLHP